MPYICNQIHAIHCGETFLITLMMLIGNNVGKSKVQRSAMNLSKATSTTQKKAKVKVYKQNKTKCTVFCSTYRQEVHS